MTSSSDSVGFHCPNCKKKLVLTGRQQGKKVRCPKCQSVFMAPRTRSIVQRRQAAAEDANELIVKQSEKQADVASDANEAASYRHSEVVPPSPPRQERAKTVANFPRQRELVFKATLRAISALDCDVETMDRVNCQVSFSIPSATHQGLLHKLTVLDIGDESSEVQIIGVIDASHRMQLEGAYQRITDEIGKYLLFTEGSLATRDTTAADRLVDESNVAKSAGLVPAGQMYCSTCGQVLSTKAVICTNCGSPTAKFRERKSDQGEITPGTIAMCYVVGMLVPLVGWGLAVYLMIKGRVEHGLGVGIASTFMFFVGLAML